MSARGPNARPNGAAGGPGKICQFKLVLLGESAVGKSSLVLRFVKGKLKQGKVGQLVRGVDHLREGLTDTRPDIEVRWRTFKNGFRFLRPNPC